MDLDSTSKHILIRLNEVEKATAPDLRDSVGVDQSQQIHYRMDNKLIPRNLVVEGARREEPGSRRNSRVYRITEDGKNWVEEHRHEVTLNSIDEAEAAIERLSERISDVSETTEELCEWRSESSGQLGGLKSRLSGLSEDVEDLEYRVQKHDDADYNQRISSQERRLKDINRKYQSADNELSQEIEELRSDVRGINTRIDTIEDHVSHIEQQQMDMADHLQSIERRLSELENRTVLDRLRRWFSR
jgi:chromosome segregation ATPase